MRKVILVFSLFLVLFISLVSPKAVWAIPGQDACCKYGLPNPATFFNQFWYFDSNVNNGNGACRMALAADSAKAGATLSCSLIPLIGLISGPFCAASMQFIDSNGIISSQQPNCPVKDTRCDGRTNTCISTVDPDPKKNWAKIATKEPTCLRGLFEIPYTQYCCQSKPDLVKLGVGAVIAGVSLSTGPFLAPVVMSGTLLTQFHCAENDGANPPQALRRECGNNFSRWEYNAATGRCQEKELSLWSIAQRKNCGPEVDVLDGYDLAGNPIYVKEKTGISTGIGCVPVSNLTDLLKWILRYVFFASGGIILVMILITGYTIITSQGNPEKLQGARENIIALFSGLILIAFSFLLLQVVGADILKLSPFTGP